MNQNLKEDAMIEEAIASAELSLDTPDTEWEKIKTGVIEIASGELYDADSDHTNIAYFEEKVCRYLDFVLPNLLSSRDTYWEESLRKEVDAEIADAVDLTKREIKHRVERYFKDAYLALKQQGGVHIHLEEIQEIIDDSTPPGFAPTPLQDK